MKNLVIRIEPSMIAGNWGKMAEEAKACQEAGISTLHLDVMDGHFVPNLTMGPDLVRAIKKAVPNLILDVHLMIYNPDNYVESFIEAGADEITFHLEATEEVGHVIDYIRKCNKKAGLSIKPETSVNLLLKYLDKLDKVLIMTVHPGFGGQKFMPDMLEKVQFIREQIDKLKLPTHVQVDGGINFDTLKLCLESGANLFVIGTHFFQAKDRKKRLEEYLSMANPYKVKTK